MFICTDTITQTLIKGEITMTVKEKILEELKKEWENSEDYEEEYREGLAVATRIVTEAFGNE